MQDLAVLGTEVAHTFCDAWVEVVRMQECTRRLELIPPILFILGIFIIIPYFVHRAMKHDGM